MKFFREHARGFDELGAVQEDEGLQGRVGGVAAGDADDAFRHVEGFKHGRRAGAPPEGVNAAPVEFLALAGRRGFERLGEIVGVDGRAADFFHEEAAHRQRLVANHFGRQTVARSAREPDVFRIVRHDLGRGEAALPVGLREHDGFEERLHIPAGADKLAGEPIEQLGIFGAVALAAEVIDGFHEAAAEEGLPETIHRHAREQRMARVGQPAREAEAVARLVGGKRRERRGSVGADGGATLIVFAPLENVGGPGLRQFAHHHDVLRLVGEFGLRGARGGERRELGAVGLVVIREVMAELRLALGGRERTGGKKFAHFHRGQRAAEDAEVVHEPAREAAVAEPFAEGDRVAAAARDVLGEMVADDFGARRAAVDEQAEAGGAARAVVGDGDVNPFVERERIEGADRNRIAGPEVNERPFRAAVLDQEFVAAAAGVGPRARTVEHDGALLRVGRLNPEGNRERLVAREVAELGVDRVVAGEADGLAGAGAPGNRLVFLRSEGVVVGVEGIGEATEAGNFFRGRLGRFRRGGGGIRRGGFGGPRAGVAQVEVEAREFVLNRRGRRRRLRQPRGESLAARLAHAGEGGLGFAHVRGGGGIFLFVRRVGQPHRGRGCRLSEIGIEPGLVDVLKKRGERIKILLRDRIELVVVATAALEGEPEERGAKGGHAVVDVVDAVFLLDGAALALLRMQAVEGGGEHLLVGGGGQQITRELPRDEFIPREILVEGLDHPIAPRPHLALAVHLKPVAVGVARDVEPVGRHALAVARRSEEPVNQAEQGVGRAVRGEGGGFSGSRGQAGEVEGHAANQRRAVGFRLERAIFSGESARDEPVEGRSGREARGERRRPNGGERDEGPVALIRRALVDPALEGGNFGRREAREFRFRRRHPFLLIRARDAQDQFALRALARKDHGGAVFHAKRAFLGVEAQLGLAALFIRAVAVIAFVRQDRLHFAAKIDGRRGRGECGEHNESRE